MSVRIGTRASKLALMQTELVAGRLQGIDPTLDVEVVKITTGGDKNRSVPIVNLGGTGVFVKELEDALMNKEVDLVVHSLKDMPTESHESLTIVAVLNREDPRDVLVSREHRQLSELTPGSKVATSSRRRLAQLKALRKDLEFIDIRGNVPTRVEKMDSGAADAIVLASAGLTRLAMADRITHYFEENECTPAAGQGALAVQCRADDRKLVETLSLLDETAVRKEISAERAFLKVLGGGCSVPIGARAKLEADDTLLLTGCVASLDGSRIVRETLSVKGAKIDAEALGRELAELILATPARQILEELKLSDPNKVSPP
ncbi:MAG TPA: hydroxymethylbilane synthase [Candidatus Melainabacteria bacterium]|nr:hydroxymethylbilane synthase [Candidatus Melainabacteria bacterium]